MGQSDKGPTGREGSGWQNRLPLAQFVRKVLLETKMVSGLAFVEDALEAERETICGPRYRHDMRRRAVRAGRVPSSLYWAVVKWEFCGLAS